MGSGLAIATGVAIKNQHKWLAAAMGTFSALTSLAIGLGLLKEHK